MAFLYAIVYLSFCGFYLYKIDCSYFIDILLMTKSYGLKIIHPPYRDVNRSILGIELDLIGARTRARIFRFNSRRSVKL